MSDDRYAAFLRCSNEELQNPELSLDRQLRNCETAAARWGGQVVAVYYEVETGTARYEARGVTSALALSAIPIPRAGGLHDLVDDAHRTPRPFDRVVCESINRLTRSSLVAFQLEDEFRQVGVGLHCADEPFEESFGSVVLRHLNIGIAVGYHRDLMAKSRQGFEAATRQGWHVGGIACYGYRLVPHEHPNPNKARRGLARHTLGLDPVRAPVVRRIYDEYLHGTRGITQVRDLLNSDPERFPPPVSPDPARALGVWSRTSVWEILRNPKYTGYQVWNRRARKQGGKPNPPDQWVWSEEPCHPPIVSKDEYQQVQAKAASNARSRRGDGRGRPVRKKTEYLFRGRLVCGGCGLRMWGSRPTHTYYRCIVAHQRGANIPPGHPATVNLSERVLTEATTSFLAQAVYGPDRLAYWTRVLDAAGHPDPTAPTRQRITEIQRTIADLERRLRNQVLALDDDEIPPAARRQIGSRIAELERAISDHQASLAKLHNELDAAPPDAGMVADLLDQLPLFGQRLAELSHAELRRLFDSLDLTVTYDPNRHTARVNITLARDGGPLRGSGPCPAGGTPRFLPDCYHAERWFGRRGRARLGRLEGDVVVGGEQAHGCVQIPGRDGATEGVQGVQDLRLDRSARAHGASKVRDGEPAAGCAGDVPGHTRVIAPADEPWGSMVAAPGA
jgi:DNA invertase Pin-like site-specific DNA recombinase